MHVKGFVLDLLAGFRGGLAVLLDDFFSIFGDVEIRRLLAVLSFFDFLTTARLPVILFHCRLRNAYYWRSLWFSPFDFLSTCFFRNERRF